MVSLDTAKCRNGNWYVRW